MKVGFVTIVGRPNVGKSTLLNNILDYKVSITSDKPQTTRDQIKGIYNREDLQIVFVDTPGIHKPKQKLGESLNDSSYKAIKDVDLILFLIPADEEIGPGDKWIIEKIKGKNATAVITKIDKSNMEDVTAKAEKLKTFGFKEVIATSVENQESLNHLIDYIEEKMPEGVPFYDQEDITDKSMRFIAKEIIRESAIENTMQELPHSIGITIEDYDESRETHDYIRAYIHVERDSQKGIVIGNKGAMIRKIHDSAVEKLQELTGSKVRLELLVKVNKRWTSKPDQIIKMGY